MKIKSIVLPSLALGAAALLVMPGTESKAFSLIGGNLNLGQRDVRIFNNFSDPGSNNNTATHSQFPNAIGAELSLWKGVIEWGSIAHGTGSGDPTQAILGSGGANYDPFWAGNATGVGSTNDNITSTINNCSSGVIAFAETPISDGWRIRFCDGNFNFADGPGNIGGGAFDIQGIMSHEFGHALGLGHSTVGGATMFASAAPGSESERSIQADDSAGVKAIYGVISSTKPIITSIDVSAGGGQMTIRGSNFGASDIRIWFRSPNATVTGGDPRVQSQPQISTNGGTQITLGIPATAGPGDVMVRNSGSASIHSLLSNAFPSDLSDTNGGPSFTISNVTPGTVEALIPGIDQTVTVTGTGLDNVSTITLNPSAEILPSSYTIVNSNTITLDMPQATKLGTSRLRFSDGTAFINVDITIVEPAEPKLQLGNGVALNGTANGNDLRVITSGVVGTQHRIFFSTSPVPSSVPILTLQFGNQFAELFQGPTFTIPAEGFFEHFETIVGIGAPTVFYAQSVDLTTPISPDFDVSNLQTITLTP